MIKRELKREGQERKKIAKKQREWEEIKLKERKRGRDSVIGSIRDREEERVRRKKRSVDRAIRNKKINEYSICNVRIWKW